MAERDLLLVSKEDGICTLTINRPEKRNILTREAYQRLGEALRSASGDGQTRVVVLRGAGEKAFSSGYDISRLKVREGDDDKDPMENVILAVETCAVPVIAMIYGYCVAAGCGLAAACDLRVAADNARLGVTAARIGVVYPPSATLRLIDLIGVSATRDLLYTGKLIDAAGAREIGLVDLVVPADRLSVAVYDLAREIAANAPLSVRGNKRIVAALLESRSLDRGARDEYLKLRRQATASLDLAEGMKAFAEKRRPVFRGE